MCPRILEHPSPWGATLRGPAEGGSGSAFPDVWGSSVRPAAQPQREEKRHGVAVPEGPGPVPPPAVLSAAMRW